MKYITVKRYKDTAFDHDFNIPYGAVVQEKDDWLFYKSQPIAQTTSYVAHQYFAPNNDGNGLKRGSLIRKIIRALENNDEKWEKIREDSICQQLHKPDLGEDWIWNHQFYIAPMLVLYHIASLIGVKEV